LADKKHVLPKYKVADISTAHITKEDARLLHEMNSCGEAPSYYELDEYGWLVNVDPADWAPMKELGYSNTFVALLMRAKMEGCSYLRLDRDGPVVDELPSFDW